MYKKSIIQGIEYVIDEMRYQQHGGSKKAAEELEKAIEKLYEAEEIIINAED